MSQFQLGVIFFVSVTIFVLIYLVLNRKAREEFSDLQNYKSNKNPEKWERSKFFVLVGSKSRYVRVQPNQIKFGADESSIYIRFSGTTSFLFALDQYQVPKNAGESNYDFKKGFCTIYISDKVQIAIEEADTKLIQLLNYEHK